MIRGGGAAAALAAWAAIATGGIGGTAALAERPSAAHGQPDQRRSDELDMLARARAEWPANNGDSAEDIRNQAIEAEVERRVRAAEENAELDRLSDIIRRKAAARGTEVMSAPALRPPSDTPPPPAAAGPAAARATVLLTITPGRNGIRRLAPTADPILCAADVCWISRGPELDAMKVPRRKALGAFNTLGDRAGACNDSVGCVFRNVDLGDAATVLQPVDLRLMQHDRREPSTVHIDHTCRAEPGTVSCAGPQGGPDYQLWVVPEDVARQAGWRALTRMVGAERDWWDRRMR